MQESSSDPGYIGVHACDGIHSNTGVLPQVLLFHLGDAAQVPEDLHVLEPPEERCH